MRAFWRLSLRAMCTMRGDQRGTVLVLSAFALPVLIGMVGLAFERANWYQVKRSAQNAADSAVVAAASNGGSDYAAEARAVASQYGFQDGASNTSVIVSNAATCPSGGSSCYSVSITRAVPLIFAQVVGFKGNVTGSTGVNLTSIAVAARDTTPREYCILALASSGTSQGIRSNGAPKANLNGCNVMSNTDTVCNGHNLGAGFGDAHGSSTGCGTSQTSGVPVVSDPYSSLASNIPPNTCSSYPQAPTKKKDPDLPSSNQISGTISLTGNQTVCGDLQLTGNVTLAGSNLVLVIRNGKLDTNGYTIKTATGAAVTIVFSGDNGSYSHAPTGGGTLDIAAPTSGPWSGVAMYQDPNLNSGVDISDAGNSPTWNVTGLVYLPHANVTFSGAVNKSTNGKSCFGLVVDNVTINGTGSISTQGECQQAGLTLPQGNIPARGRLVS
jgi:Flp pilus assembly protein TadG